MSVNGTRESTQDGRRVSRWSYVSLVIVIALAAAAVRLTLPDNNVEAQSNRQRTRTAQPSGKSAAQQSFIQRDDRKNVSAASIAAVVNGESISKQLVGRQCLIRWGDETLESLVNKQLITAACQQRRIEISDQAVDQEIESIARKFGMSADQYLTMIETERDVSATEYRRDIIWPTLALKMLAADRLTVTKEQLDREYESEFGPKVRVRMISLTSPQKAAKVLAEAKANPDDFPRLAKTYSEDPNSASAKGLIPAVRRHIGEPEVERAVFALQPGQISEVVKAANQYFIFRCEELIDAAHISPQYRPQVDARLRERIVERNLRDASKDIFKELQSKSKIVNVYNNEQLRKQKPGVAALVNQQQITIKDLTDECLLRHGREMVENEINYRLLSQQLKKRKLAISQADINSEVGRAAMAFGYIDSEGRPNINEWVKAVTEQEGIGVKEYVRDAVWPSVALKQLVNDKVTVTEEDLQKGFEANYGERVEVLAIVLNNQRVAKEVWDMARKNDSREFFGQLAEQYSVEAVSRANYGEIPPIRKHGGQDLIEDEAFRLQPGELSGIVATSDKFIIMKCIGRTTPIVEEITDVRDELVKDIREKKLRLAMAEEFDRIRSEAQIDNFLAGTSQTGRKLAPERKSNQVPIRPVSTKK